MTPDRFPVSSLLSEAARVLQGNDFAVVSELLEGTEAETQWVLAESDLFIIAVVAAQDLSELRKVEAWAAPGLVERITQRQAGSKRWDAYLVLMTQGTVDDDDARKLVDLEYDTKGVRRVVAVDMEPTNADVRRVLQPFLPLGEHSGAELQDAFRDLEDQLVVHGVDSTEAQEMVAMFRSQGDLEHA